jgi:hypothetical protein
MLYPVATPPKPALKSSAKLKSATSTPVKSTAPTREKEITRDLAALRAALSPLLSARHANVALLARVIELRALIALGRWAEVGAALERAEAALGITISSPAPASDTEPPLYTTSPFHAALVVHVLVLGVVWVAYSTTPAPTHAPAAGTENGAGKEGGTGSTAVSARLTLLYSLLDAGVYNGKCRVTTADGQNMGLESEGVLEVHSPFYLQPRASLTMLPLGPPRYINGPALHTVDTPPCALRARISYQRCCAP